MLLAEALPRRRERHHLIAMSEEEFRRLTARALDNYGDLGRLLRSPLIDLPTVDRRLTGQGAEKPLARAIELRAVLRESVARLKPDGLFGTTEEWRYYNALLLLLRARAAAVRPAAAHPTAWTATPGGRSTGSAGTCPGARCGSGSGRAPGMVADRLWGELVRTDPRWLTRAGALAAPPTRST